MTKKNEIGPDQKYCRSCGEIIKEEAVICPECGVRQGGGQLSERVLTAILAILLGSFGVHKFYLGDTGLGILYLCFSWTGIPAIVGIIEGVIYLSKSDEEFEKEYVHR
jgi:TM2 domain-containing membrane protein YozV